MMNRPLASLLLLTSLGACGSQADDGYQGDLLARLRGEITSSRTVATPAAEAAVVWFPNDDYPLVPTLDRVEVEGEFPASFSLDLTEPPPAEGSRDGSGDLAIGFITVLAAGTTQEDLDTDEEGAFVLGVDERHMLVWVGDADAAAEELAFYGLGDLGPGYHIVGVHGLDAAQEADYEACLSVAETEEAQQACDDDARAVREASNPGIDFDDRAAYFDVLRPAADGLDTALAIDLKDSVDDIDMPNFE